MVRGSRSRAFVGVPLLAWAVLWATPGHAAAVPECANEPATIVGTNGPDAITGTAGDDVILALGGNDVIVGLGAGRDAVCGGNGNDTIVSDAQPAAPSVFLHGDDGDDLLRIDNGGDAHLDGGVGNDTLLGSDGFDAFFPGPGDDVMEGGDSNDFVGYETSPSAVTVNLSSGVADGEGHDTLGDIESVSGSPFVDRIVGDDEPNELSGGPEDGMAGDTLIGLGGDDDLFRAEVMLGGDGDDFLAGGDCTDCGGVDVHAGGPGMDTMSFTTGGGVVVNLLTGTARGSTIGDFPISGIENVLGSGYADVLIGDNADNLLNGYIGPGFRDEPGDIIIGGGGDDTLQGQAGNDHLYGGPGDDHLVGGPDDDVLDGGLGANDVCERGERLIGCEIGRSSVTAA